MIYSVLPLVFCLVTNVVYGLLNLPSMYLIGLAREQSSSLIFILRICVATGPLTAYSKALARLVGYLILRASAWFFATFLPEYSDWSPFVISPSLTLYVTCGNCLCSWVICRPL